MKEILFKHGRLRMIDVESLWTSESPLENLHTTIDAFYDFMCNKETLPLEQILKLDDKHDFAFLCSRCGDAHAEHGRVWSMLAVAIKQNYPAEDHPEYEEYFRVRREFMSEVKHIDVRDYAEPFIKETDEWQYVEAALEDQKKDIETFLESLCRSHVTPETAKDVAVVVGYYCDKHDTNHYITPQRNNEFRSSIGGARVPEQYLPMLSKLAQRIVLRDLSAKFRDFIADHPQTKTDSIAFQVTQKQKQAQKAANREKEMKAAALKAEKKAAAKELIVKKKKSKKTNKNNPLVHDPKFYILKPELMSDEWLAEYHVCGRKVAHPTVSDALVFKHTNGLEEEYKAYECPYCSGWHLGREGKGITEPTSKLAKKGLFWYRRNYKKANIFIHRIMMEEFN